MIIVISQSLNPSCCNVLVCGYGTQVTEAPLQHFANTLSGGLSFGSIAARQSVFIAASQLWLSVY